VVSQVEKSTIQGEKMRKISGIFAASVLVASIALVAPAAHAKETITGSGSSYMNSFQQTCSAAYTANTVTYTSKGSGTGKTEFANGTTNFGGSDSLYSSDAPSNFVYVPLVGGPVGIIYNIKGVTNLRLTPQLLDGIFTGKIKKWNAAAIKAQNPAAKLPNKSIQVVYRSNTSGTTNNFGNFMAQNVGGTWKAADAWADASGSTIGTGAVNNSGVVTTVAGLANSISFADVADAKAAKLRFASIRNAMGQFVQPTPSAASRFLAKQTIASNGELIINHKAKISGGYPVVLVAYGLAPTKSSNANSFKAAAVKDYFTYIINTCGPQSAAAGGYVAISGALKTKALSLIARIK
jgi:phosphate transport system substrate-binding protein